MNTAADIVVNPLGSARERKRVFDDVWMLTLFAIFLALAAPWFLRLLNVDLAPLAWSLFGLGVLQVIGAVAGDQMTTGRRLLVVTLFLQLTGIAFLAVVWYLAGGLQNPMFLLVFVLPVVAGSIALPGWLSMVSVLFTLVTVGIVALLEVPELRWQLTQTGVPVERLMAHLPVPASVPGPFPTLNTPAAYLYVALALFAILLLAIAMMMEAVNVLVVRLYRRLAASAAALGIERRLSIRMLEASPFPAARVYRDTLGIEHANRRFLDSFGLRPESLGDKSLLELVDFSYPDMVEDLIRGAGGELPATAYRIGSQTRVGRIFVDAAEGGGPRVAHLSVQDISDQYYLTLAFTAADEAVFVVGADELVRYANSPAQALFAELAVGAEASRVLERPELPNGWWVPGMRRGIERELVIAGTSYRANCLTAAIPGEREKVTIVRLCRVDREA